MESLISQVDWVDKSDILEHLLKRGDPLTAQSMDQGFEAEVVKLYSDQMSFVLKVWNKGSEPDIRVQFELLKALSAREISVSKPMGWGINARAEKVLLTSFDGTSVVQLDEMKMMAIAKILSNIHKIRVQEMGNIVVPKYDFRGYFFAEAREYDDLDQALTSLVPLAKLKQEEMIHGDFHLNNIVEDSERLTVIDWTNGQLGDARYDFAWSLILAKIYMPKRLADAFRSAYLSENNIPPEELELFEALAILRWIFLKRRGGTPKRPDTMERVNALMTNNSFLNKLEFEGIPSKKRSGDGMNMEEIFERFPVLKSDNYELSVIEERHLDDLFDIYDNDNVFEFCGIIPKHNKATVRSMIGHFERDYNKRSRVKWGIFARNEGDRLIGIVEAFDFNQKVNMVSIGYFLAESQWGKGIATEAVSLLVRFLFMDAGVNRIQAEVMPGNEISKKVLLKNGFVKEGTLRQATLWSGKGIVDLEIYGMLRDDYVK